MNSASAPASSAAGARRQRSAPIGGCVSPGARHKTTARLPTFGLNWCRCSACPAKPFRKRRSRSPWGEPPPPFARLSSNYRMRACWRSIRSPASSSRAFRSLLSRRPSSSARRWRRPPRGLPRNVRHRVRFWRCSRSWNGSARPAPPETATRSIRPTKCFMLQRFRSMR